MTNFAFVLLSYYERFLKKCTSGNNTKEMKRLVFFYGTKECDSNGAFDFLPESNFIDYHSDGAEKYSVAPKVINDKMCCPGKESLNKDEEQIVNGLYELFIESKLNERERVSNLLISNETCTEKNYFMLRNMMSRNRY